MIVFILCLVAAGLVLAAIARFIVWLMPRIRGH